MNKCLKCEQETVENAWGNWCDPCGGVVLGNPPRLFFRHVATVEGAGGRFPIIFDISEEAYGVSWPKVIHTIRCIHCGQDTPAEIRRGLHLLDDIKSRGHHSSRGTLDEMIALIQPKAQGDSTELPEIFLAPTTTEAEKSIITA